MLETKWHHTKTNIDYLVEVLDIVYYIYGYNKTDDKKLYLTYGFSGPKKSLRTRIEVLLR